MKKTLIIVVITLAVISALYLVFKPSKTTINNDYPAKVLEKLNTIKSASYISTGSASAPGDTMSFSEPRSLFIKEFVNPADTNTGASNASFNPSDTSRLLEFYDGTVRGNINWETKIIKIDSFQDHPYPFRLVYFPFFTKTASIINYALHTKDSIKTELKDFGDSVLFSLFVYNRVVEFVTKPFIDPHPYEPESGKISQYDIWIHKSDNLPYRMRRKMNHNTSFEACTDVKLNISPNPNLIASEYFPADFKIVQFIRDHGSHPSNLIGKTAPDWILKDIDSKEVAFRDLKSKVLMIQFTGVGCGPCHQSLPFIKTLVNDLKSKDFEFIAIETWSKNIAGLKRYYDMNGLNFKFLKSETSVSDSYQVSAVPVFLILDNMRVIRNVINGYSKGSTDKEILKTINDLLVSK